MKLLPETPSFTKLVGDMLFVVPEHFQREYSWESEEWDLWSDVLRTRDAQSEHFMGLVVLSDAYTDEALPAAPALGSSVFIIDGQQRIATCTIFASCLYRKIGPDNATLRPIREALSRLTTLSTVTDVTNAPRVRLSSEAAQQVLREVTDLDCTPVVPQGPRRPVAAKRVWGAYQFFAGSLDRLFGLGLVVADYPDVKTLYTTLAERLQFLLLRVPGSHVSLWFRLLKKTGHSFSRCREDVPL